MDWGRKKNIARGKSKRKIQAHEGTEKKGGALARGRTVKLAMKERKTTYSKPSRRHAQGGKVSDRNHRKMI